MIRKGKIEDIDMILDIIADTVKIMELENNDQWDETYPSHKILEEDIRVESLYVLEEGKNVTGTITIDKREPSEYDGIPWRKQEPAYTFHRLAVSPDKRGKGSASQLIYFAEKIAVKNNISYMKVDTYSRNLKAQSLFEKSGYQKVGELFFKGKRHPFLCYDKLLTR